MLLKNYMVYWIGSLIVDKIGFDQRNKLPDHVDCVIVASAASRNKGVLIEDHKILALREYIAAAYNIGSAAESNLGVDSQRL